jgi:hypothetical protein
VIPAHGLVSRCKGGHSVGTSTTPSRSLTVATQSLGPNPQRRLLRLHVATDLATSAPAYSAARICHTGVMASMAAATRSLAAPAAMLGPKADCVAPWLIGVLLLAMVERVRATSRFNPGALCGA